MLHRMLFLAGMGMLCALVLGCAAQPLDAGALRRQFPDQADAVLEGRSRFGASRMRLPDRGEDAMRFDLPDGGEVEVRELGGSGEAAAEEDAVVYARTGGASFWSTTDTGAEEWLWLAADAVRSDAPVAVWEVTGATLRECGDMVEVVDESGTPQVRVTAPEAYAVGGEPVATRLAVREASVELWVEADGEAVLVDPGWVGLKQPMNAHRKSHTSTLLGDGSVIVVGGLDGDGLDSGALLSSELFNPSSKTWTLTNTQPSITPSVLGAVRLPSGDVLVAGGTSPDVGYGQQAVADAELFEPSSQMWASIASMSTARQGHTVTLLQDGRILVAGGVDENGNGLASAEIFDPASPTWSTTGSMSTPRAGHSATLLPDGRVLVAGGTDSAGTAEIFDPSSSTWSPTGSMSAARTGHTATLLLDGRVVVAGGVPVLSQAYAELGNIAEVFDPSSQTWTPTQPMNAARNDHTATLLPDGTVLIAGGVVGDVLSADSTAEIFSPALESWTPAGTMSTPRAHHTATLLADGRVLVAGGADTNVVTNVLNSAEVFDTSTETWTPTRSMSVARDGHTATQLLDGRVLVAGGVYMDDTCPVPWQLCVSAEVFDPTAQTWTQTGPMSVARSGHTATLLPDGRVIVAGGAPPEFPDCDAGTTAEIFDPVSGTWTLTQTMHANRTWHTATLLPDGRVLVAGGYGVDGAGADGVLNSAEIFDPASQTWTQTGSMSAARQWHTATLLGDADGHVLVAGGACNCSSNEPVPLDSAEVFSPQSGVWTPVQQPMNTSRFAHTATRLLDGRVLVAGGYGGVLPGGPVDTAEVFDPSSPGWTLIQPMSAAREWHTATLLKDGRVLAAGGTSVGGAFIPVSSAELLDPSSLMWTPMPSMHAARATHTATRLGDGRVLVVGGYSGLDAQSDPEPLRSAEIWSLQPNGTGCGTNDLDCLSGFCTDGVCCDQACDEAACEACSEALGAVADGTCTPLHPECSPFACSPDTGACETSCQTVADCAGGYTCDPVSSECVLPGPTQVYRDDGGCALSSAEGRAPTWMGLGLLAALAAVRRARRRARRMLSS
jgi:N-acetylneuraminic acid mutarotase